MKNVAELAKKTESIKCKDMKTWIPLYYSIREDAVFSDPGEGRYKLCNLINQNTGQDIIETVNHLMNM